MSPIHIAMAAPKTPMSESPDTIAESPSRFSTFSSQQTLWDFGRENSDHQFPNGKNHAQPWGEAKKIWIPSEHSNRNRTLILCFDGTGDHFDSDNSNVVQLVSTLKKDDVSKQLVYYQAGIGTYADPILKTPIFEAVSRVLDEMLATNLSSHIKAGYNFLMQNYTFGDKICIFGFSRGAYTARALAGMLQKVGLLSPHNFQQIPFAYDMYKREDEEGFELSETFKRTFCRDVTVDFLGVWDTVASVGLIPRYLPFIAENNGIRHLRHALALDERRIKFLPNYCVDPVKKREKKPDARPGNKHRSLSKEYEDMVNEEDHQLTDVLEVWFPGVHADVGGGSVKNDTPSALSRIPLRWMIRQCFECNTGMIFDAVMLQQLGLAIYLDDNTGEPALVDKIERLPAEYRKCTQRERNKNMFFAILRLIWAFLTYRFFILLSLLRLARRHPARHTHVSKRSKFKRKVLPARHDPSSCKLQYHDRDEACKHEAEEERKDALSPLYDQLNAAWIWHILEWMPQKVKKQKAISRGWKKGGYHWVWNRGQGRKIVKDEMDEGLKVHRSVKTRLEAGEAFVNGLYEPKVRPNLHSKEHAPGSREPKMLPHEEWNVDEPVHWEWVA